jgi:hypothetical protein
LRKLKLNSNHANVSSAGLKVEANICDTTARLKTSETGKTHPIGSHNKALVFLFVEHLIGEIHGMRYCLVLETTGKSGLRRFLDWQPNAEVMSKHILLVEDDPFDADVTLAALEDLSLGERSFCRSQW